MGKNLKMRNADILSPPTLIIKLNFKVNFQNLKKNFKIATEMFHLRSPKTIVLSIIKSDVQLH